MAEFAENLRNSYWAQDGNMAAVLELATPLVAELPADADVPEFVELVQQAQALGR